MRLPQLALSALLVFAATGLAACDTGGGGGIDESDVDGVYTITGLTFDPQPSALSNVDVKARIGPASSLTLASNTESYVLNFRFLNDTGQYLLSGRYSTSSRNRVVIDFGDRATDRRRLLLPREITFTFDETTGTLTADQTLTNVDLATYDPDQYGGLNAVDGRLLFTLRRQ